MSHKFKTLILPFYAIVAILVIGIAAPSHATNSYSLDFKTIKVSTKVDLGQVTFTFDLVPINRSENVAVQLFVHRMPQNSWEFVEAAKPGAGQTIFPLFRGLDNTVQFTVDLPMGSYDSYRLLLFASADGTGSNDTILAYDSASDKVKRMSVSFNINSHNVRIKTPHLVYATLPDVKPDSSGTYTATIPAKLKIPKGYVTPDNGFWLMAKGTGGFSQVWAEIGTAVGSTDPDDNYLAAPVMFNLTGLKPGIWNVQFGVFKSTWGDPLEWAYPGLDFEVGGDSWETKATQMPPRLQVVNRKFMQISPGAPSGLKPYKFYSDTPDALKSVGFIRGGNYGNALDWDIQPALNTPGYFVLLSDIGCRFVRVLFSPDRYLSEDLYQHAVDQVVQNIWAAGLYPVIGPQDLPTGDNLALRVDRGEAVCRLMAMNYKGRSVWIEVTNEPREFSQWSVWKPVAERYVKTIRAIDPNAFVVVPFEFYQKDGRAAAKDPITSVHVDLYDGHAYIGPADVQRVYGPALTAGLPVLIGEYGGDASYLTALNRKFQALSPPPMGIAPWAFTIKGQDSLPLVQASTGADISYTPAGAAVAKDYDAWLNGKKAN